MSLIFGEFFKLKKTSLECTSQEQQKFKPRHCVLECSEKVIIYNTFLDATVYSNQKQKTKTLIYKTLPQCHLCIKAKNRKQKHNTRLYDSLSVSLFLQPSVCVHQLHFLLQ